MKSCTNPTSKPKNMACSNCRQGLSKTLIILGFLSVVFGIASIPVCISEVKYLGAPIWSGLFVIATGAVGIKSGRSNKSNAWLTAYLVLGLISLMTVLTACTWTVGGITGDMEGLYGDEEEHHDEDYGLEEWLDELDLDHLPENFDELTEHLPENFEELDGFRDLEDLRDLDEEEWGEWIEHFLSERNTDDEEEHEEDEEHGDDREKRSGHHEDHLGHRPRPDDAMEDGHGEGHEETWFDWDENGKEDKEKDDELDNFHTSIAMFSITLILAFIELIVVFASSVTACCGLCKTSSQVVPQQIIVLQPGQQVVPGANGQFVVVNAGHGQDIGIYHGARPSALTVDMTPSTNPALTSKPSGQPHGRLPPLATAPSYEEAVALPPKDDPAPEYQEAEELPTKISL